MKIYFHVRENKDDVSPMLLTIFVNNDLKSIAQEVQENIIRDIHQIFPWFLIEIVSYGQRHVFESFKVCDKQSCKKNFVVEYKTSFYFMVTNNVQDIANIFDVLESMKSFNPISDFLIYLHTKNINHRNSAEYILNILWDHFMSRGAVLVAENQTDFNLFQMSFDTRGPSACYSNRSVNIVDTCVEGETVK